MCFFIARLMCNDLTPVSTKDLTTNPSPEGRKVAALQEQLSPDCGSSLPKALGGAQRRSMSCEVSQPRNTAWVWG